MTFEAMLVMSGVTRLVGCYGCTTFVSLKHMASRCKKAKSFKKPSFPVVFGANGDHRAAYRGSFNGGNEPTII